MEIYEKLQLCTKFNCTIQMIVVISYLIVQVNRIPLNEGGIAFVRLRAIRLDHCLLLKWEVLHSSWEKVRIGLYMQTPVMVIRSTLIHVKLMQLIKTFHVVYFVMQLKIKLQCVNSLCIYCRIWGQYIILHLWLGLLECSRSRPANVNLAGISAGFSYYWR